MIYLDAEGVTIKRRVKVLSLREDSFRVYCYLRRETRTFKIDGVLAHAPLLRGLLWLGWK